MNLAVEAGIADAPVDRVQAIFEAGILSAVLKTADPRAVNLEMLRRVLAGELAVKAAERIFAVWKTIAIGGKSASALVDEMEQNGFFVSEWARDLVAQAAFKTSPEPQEVSFVRAAVRELGFTEEPTTAELLARVKKAGELCRPEDGPHLRLADSDQPNGTRYWVLHEPITDSGGWPLLFYVGRHADGERWLRLYPARPGYRWDLAITFVFRLRK